LKGKDDVSVSKFLSLVLRHQPEKVGVTLDKHGWIDVDTLLSACKRHGYEIAREQLQRVIDTNDKKRFALSEDGTKIRASQGHSIEIDLGYQPTQPPETLYCGTATRFLDSIFTEGLKKMSRHDVHLTASAETARTVGSRHGKPVVLTIAARKMSDDGYKFYVTPNGVWLTDTVPPQYIVSKSSGEL
jgi:putative RNA 2'-phosphotransferase